MKRLFFLFAVCILTAFVAPEAKAQCPPEEDCGWPGEEGEDGNTYCWTTNAYDYWTQTANGWVHCYVIQRCCEKWNQETQQYYIQCGTFTSCGSV